MKKLLWLGLIATIAVGSVSCSSSEEQSSSTTSPASKTTPHHVMYAVGDIDGFDTGLKPLAEKIVRDDPDASWWILGDAGYGEGTDVTDAYNKLAKVLPSKSLHMIVGDHDYGTQDPSEFTSENLAITGSATILNAEETPSYFIATDGNLIDADQTTQEKVAWAITGANDICVEVETLKNSDCRDEQYADFENALARADTKTTCSIAMWHHPIYATLKAGGSDQFGSKKYGIPLFHAAVDHGADIVLNADHHHFLATKNIDKDGKLATKDGIAYTREFVVGTGGAPLSSDQQTPKLLEDAIDIDIRGEIGVLKIELYANNAKLSFVTGKGTPYTTDINC